MDFYTIRAKSVKEGKDYRIEVSPDFIVENSSDLMIRAGAFYAIWNEEAGLWSTDEYDVVRLVDAELYEFAQQKYEQGEAIVKTLRSFDSNSWNKFKKFTASITNSYTQLDNDIQFANSKIKKDSYASRVLPYALEKGDHSAWDELVSVLYSPDERKKIEWAIGSLVAGDSKRIQKFLVFYGAPGTGKSTILNILHKMFYDYATVFEAKALASSNNSFATETFKSNPLLAIQHDGDLSRIEDNTKLNSIVAHEEMLINEKYKAGYMSRVNAMLFMGTNQPVKISDARSGIIRRLIDVNPTGDKIPSEIYQALMKRIEFEFGAIAEHCLKVYKKMGVHYYDAYRPVEMMFKTDSFFNFVEAHFDVFSECEGISLKRAWSLYKEYVAEANLPYSLQMSRFREELKDYFKGFEQRKIVDGQVVTSWYHDFDASKFKIFQAVETKMVEPELPALVLDKTESLLDDILQDQPAQYAKPDGTPRKPWGSVDTTLGDLNTKKLHYVKVPENHIVIDFDLKGEDNERSLARNLRAASEWPITYAELSKSGGGIHLHYIYTGGEANALSPNYADGIEVKVYRGDSSLRRLLSQCNAAPVATLSGGLPLKEKKPMLHDATMKSEKGLRDLIGRNLRKEIHPGTKPSIDFIAKILDDANKDGMVYDVTDLRPRIMAFANNSSNQALTCLKIVQKMKFASDTIAEDAIQQAKDGRVVFFDVEVYPNLFVICWKYEDDETIVKMINPSPEEVEKLFGLKLVGFNNRRFDNHILYARYMGYPLIKLYETAQKLINERGTSGTFGEAYNLSYTDIYDFSSKKQSLKKFEIELGIPHKEIDFPWDQPVDEKDWPKVVEYCCNDVMATEATFKARRQDFVARQILAELSGLSVNHTTQNHTAKIIFGNDKKPSSSFIYTDLSKEFPGYVFELGKSSYRDDDPSEGGFVYAEPGIYSGVPVLDVASMHPTSIIELCAFGKEYTPKFKQLLDARVAIKHRDYDTAAKMLDGKLAPYLGDAEDADALAYALKIVINIVYGLTSAKFENAFKDPRNKDNIVAKRGALFMIDLKNAVQEQGYPVVHIKTDSIKIANSNSEIIGFIKRFGEKYGYTFEEEGVYDKFCLVNDAVYIARKDGKWEAVGAQFQHPYVFKTLFSHEEVTFDDLCETKQVTKGAIYLDFDAVNKPAFDYGSARFIGRIGRFVPVKSDGGILHRVSDDKAYAVAGTKGYFWIEADVAETLGDKLEIDMSYFEKLADDARAAIEKFGSFDDFIS